MPSSDVVPVKPYIIEMPNSINATDSTPIRKNLIAASEEYRSRLRSPAITKPGIDTVSSATNSNSRSRADGMISMPMKLTSSRK